MRLVDNALLLAPTDLSTFIACRHRSGLDLAVAHGALVRPQYVDPYTDVLRKKGEEHEARYVESLRARGLNVTVVRRAGDRPAPDAYSQQTAETLAALRAGTDVIVQARLAGGGMAGYADVLLRVERPSRLGAWSYEPVDTKLARETRGGTILQLCAYVDLLAKAQGLLPDRFHVVTPDPVDPVQSYRVADYLAYYRMVRRALTGALAHGHEALLVAHYPEPVEHCAVCDWEARCLVRRRRDDHLSFVAGATRGQRDELARQGHATLAAAATMPVPVTFRPSRGARETYDRLGLQARMQHQQRTVGAPVFERLPVVPGEGLTRLPPPSPGDVFLDLEGARFAREGGREFLFGLWHGGPIHAGGGEAAGLPFPQYQAWWATTDEEEKQAFEAAMDLIMSRAAGDSGMHVYHFNHYEPTAFKKLVGRHVTRGDALDALLRAGRFVDLYPIVRQAVRCGVESYSIKKLEQYTGYERSLALGSVAQPLLAVELALEARATDALSDALRAVVQGYNEDDCRSTEALRDWLERQRDETLASGTEVPRPGHPDGAPPEPVKDLHMQVEALRARLLAGVGPAAAEASHQDHPRWQLAYLIDWHKREENADWWDYFRVLEAPEEDLLDEPKVITGLVHDADVDVVRNSRTGRPTGSIVRRYRYPPQEVQVGRKGYVSLQSGKRFGSIQGHDRSARTIEIKTTAAVHPTTLYSAEVIQNGVLQRSVMRLAQEVLESKATDGSGPDTAATHLLRRRTPRLRSGAFEPRAGEAATDLAVRLVTELDRTTLAIQGPPGAGKTYIGASMIRALVGAGRRVGVTASGHKVITNLLETVIEQAAQAGEPLSVARKPGDGEAPPPGPIRLLASNDAALAALTAGEVQVLGGTAWMWAREEFASSVDVLFVDEAGQMSLASTLAVAQAAGSLVLLGDPQQLDQPQKASHPDGVGISALEHVLNGSETMPADRGIFLPTTWRMSPTITRFTSELFYESKLEARASLGAQVLDGTERFDGSSLWLVPVEHDSNQTSSDEEVDAVADLVERLLKPGAHWVDQHGLRLPLTAADIRVVAPFNAQVNRLTERLAAAGVPVGTVDKFQGQTAVAVIYSMTTSRADEAPRGMEFLYSLNRLNVATSRARCAVFVVCSPRLLAPECRTPRQMHLANALCRYAEMAKVVEPADA